MAMKVFVFGVGLCIENLSKDIVMQLTIIIWLKVEVQQWLAYLLELQRLSSTVGFWAGKDLQWGTIIWKYS